MICADTSFIIDVLRGNPEAVKKLKEIEDEQLAITVITSFELYFGIFKVKNINLEKRLSDLQKILSRLIILEMSHKDAVYAAKILGNLSKVGKITSVLDCFIGGISLSHGCKNIITRNKKHFSEIEGLNIITY